MRNICLYFQVHQPYRLRTYRFFDIGEKHDYFDEFNNRLIMQRVALKSYLPMNRILLDLIKEFGAAFRVSFSISGSAIEQFEAYSPEVLKSFRALAKTGNVEFLAETYNHSLSSLNNKDEFVRQVKMHADKTEQIFGKKPVSFRNTELIYSDDIGDTVADMGYKVMLTEGAKHILGWRSPNFLYTNAINPKLKLLLRNFTLSDDIAFRFSQQSWPEWPLTTEKFVNWLNDIDENEEVVNLFMDYETFGEHQWEQTGIFDFIKALPGRIMADSDFVFSTPRELSRKLQPVSTIHAPYPISWADEERDITAWLGNNLQEEAFRKLNALSPLIDNCNDEAILRDWLFLQTSDHFYYMATKWFSDGDVHKYFNPYNGPYDAFVNYMNVLSDFIIRVNNNCKLSDKGLNDIKQLTAELAKKTEKVFREKTGKAAGKVKKAVNKGKEISFDDIKKMSDTKIKQLLGKVDIDELTIALKDAEQELVEKIIPNLGKQARKTYEEMQEEMLKVKKSDIKKYRKAIEDKIKDLFGK